MGLGSDPNSGSETHYKVVMGIFEKFYIGYVLPLACVDKTLKQLPEEILNLLGDLKTLKEIPVETRCEPVSGVVLHGKTPTSERGTYVEIYKGFMPPLPTFTPAQCVVSEEGVTLGCRYLLQKKFLNSFCEERELRGQLTPEDINNLLKKLIKTLDSHGLWLYVVDCEDRVTTLKIAEESKL